MNENNARRILTVVVPTITLVIGVVPYVLVRNDLPDRLATHFNGTTPDDSMTVGGFAAVLGTLGVVGVAMLVGLAVNRRPLQAMIGPSIALMGGFFAGLASGIFAATVLTQRGLDSWQEAGSVWVVILVSILAAVGLGAMAARAAMLLPTVLATAGDAIGSIPTMDLEPGERVVWNTTLHSRVLFLVGLLAGAIGVAIAAVTMWWVVLPSLFSALAMLTFATLRVSVDRDGLRVRYGFLPWPTTHVSVQDIETASVIDVRPMEWGGWGYRGSLRLMRQAAVVHRAGPGIRLDLRDGKIFVVTVDDPATPAGILNAEVARLAV